MKPFIPRRWQVPCIAHLQRYLRCALFAPPGSGKTSAVLVALDQLSLAGNDVWPTLVLGPLRVARDVWPAEPPKWDALQHLRVSAIIGTAAERRAALRARADVYTINYENIVWLIEELAGAWPFKTVVADESTKIKSYRAKQGGKRAQALSKVAHKSSRWINLTGTPASNGLKDLYGQTWFVDFGFRLGRSYSAFLQRWFTTDYSGYAVVPLPYATPEIHAKLEDVCLSIDMKDFVDLREPICRRIEVTLPKEARVTYREMERQLYTEVKEHKITALNAASKSMKLMQLSNGAVYTNPDTEAFVEVHVEKLDALESLVEECAGMPVLVAYNFRSDLARLRKRFPAAAVLAAKGGFDAFMTGNVSVGLGHPSSLGHGVDGMQTVTNVLAFFGHNWDLEQRLQMIERIGPMRQLQAGYDRAVYVYDIVAKDTIDDVILDRHAGKMSVQDALMAHLKHRGEVR